MRTPESLCSAHAAQRVALPHVTLRTPRHADEPSYRITRGCQAQKLLQCLAEIDRITPQ